MITFKKKSVEEDLTREAIDYLEQKNVDFDIISPEQADAVSKVNTKAMVLMSFKKADTGFYQITVKDKDFYSYTRKLLEDKDYCNMKIVAENKRERTLTAETNHKGIALDVIEVLAEKYNLSIVKK